LISACAGSATISDNTNAASQVAGSASARRNPGFNPQSACIPISLTAPENTTPPGSQGEPLSLGR